jgi:hypothetical protein
MHAWGMAGRVRAFSGFDVPSAEFTDSFDRSNGGIGSNWQVTFGSAWNVNSNAAVATAIGEQSIRVATTAVTFGANHEATITYDTTNGAVRPMVRMSSDGDGYMLYIGHTLGNSFRGIYRATNGVYTKIATTTDVAVVAGDTATIRAVGSTITAYHGSQAIGTVTDTTYGTGQPGMHAWGMAGRVRAFSATDGE